MFFIFLSSWDFCELSITCNFRMSLVGVIGLGNMGGHMARNLLRNGVKIIVNDVDPKRMDELKVSLAL